MTKNKRIDAEILKRIMIEVERRASTNHSRSPMMTNDDNSADQGCTDDCGVDGPNESRHADSGLGRSRETEYLVEFLGKVLQRVCKFVMIIILLLHFSTRVYILTVLYFRFIYFICPESVDNVCGHSKVVHLLLDVHAMMKTY